MTASAADFRCGSAGELLGILNGPYQHVGVEQDHRKTSQASGGSMGDSISPTLRITPLSLPMNYFFASSAGTSLATGFPRLVITTGSRVLRTSSIKARQRALNSPAPILFMDRL